MSVRITKTISCSMKKHQNNIQPFINFLKHLKYFFTRRKTGTGPDRKTSSYISVELDMFHALPT